MSLELFNALNEKLRQGLQNQMSLSLACIIFYVLVQLFWHNLCVSTYHIYHNTHFVMVIDMFYILGINILYSICNKNLICLFDNLDVDVLSDLYILSAKHSS